MYIVTDQADYDGADIMSAHESMSDAIRAAEDIVASRVDAWDVPKTRGDPKDAGGLGGAVRAVAFWRSYNHYDTVVWELVVTQPSASDRSSSPIASSEGTS